MFAADDAPPPPLCSIGLEPRYGLVVLGTSLTPSVVAAAASTAGKTVLHLDANEYYGGLDDATFTLDEAITWAERNRRRRQATGHPGDGACQSSREGRSGSGGGDGGDCRGWGYNCCGHT